VVVRLVELVTEVEVDNRGLEKYVLNRDDEGLVGVENVRCIFLRPILFVRQAGCDLELDLVIRSGIEFDWMVRALFWSFC